MGEYFRARSLVAEIERTPDRATSLLERASESLQGTDSGWVNSQVTCFRAVVEVLQDLLGGGDAASSVERGRGILSQAIARSGSDEHDRLALEFLDVTTEAFSLLREDADVAIVSETPRQATSALGATPARWRRCCIGAESGARSPCKG